jgi:hypothetical protein
MRRILRSYELSLETSMNVIQPVIATLLVLFSILLIDLGYQWIEHMHGLHPLVAFPGAIISVLAALIVLFTEHQCEQEEQEN